MTKGKLRNSTKFIIFTTLNALLLLAFSLHAAVSGKPSHGVTETNSALVRELGLTDLCLFTEARYTRNPAMADNHAAFQEHPAAFDHFPSGSFLPPATINRGYLHAQH